MSSGYLRRLRRHNRYPSMDTSLHEWTEQNRVWEAEEARSGNKASFLPSSGRIVKYFHWQEREIPRSRNLQAKQLLLADDVHRSSSPVNQRHGNFRRNNLTYSQRPLFCVFLTCNTTLRSSPWKRESDFLWRCPASLPSTGNPLFLFATYSCFSIYKSIKFVVWKRPTVWQPVRNYCNIDSRKESIWRMGDVPEMRTPNLCMASTISVFCNEKFDTFYDFTVVQ